MFPKKDRFPRAAFGGSIGGSRLYSPHITAAIPSSGVGYAVVISKKTLRRAVDRHLLKRRLLAHLRGQAPTLPRALILFPKASALTLLPAELQAEVAKLLSKAGLRP